MDENTNREDLNPPETEPESGGIASLYEPVYAVVRSIPAGKVMTYGQVADAATNLAFTARQVGTAMRYAPSDVPWQRVVGAGGHLPIVKLSPEASLRQRRLLEQEGVTFLERNPNRIDMPRSQWLPDAASYSGAEEQLGLF